MCVPRALECFLHPPRLNQRSNTTIITTATAYKAKMVFITSSDTIARPKSFTPHRSLHNTRMQLRQHGLLDRSHNIVRPFFHKFDVDFLVHPKLVEKRLVMY